MSANNNAAADTHPLPTTTTTTAATTEIRPIPADSVHRIVAGQAISDLASAVKELVDNALDAGSKNINIRLFNQGVDIIEVSDDGCGVPPASRPLLATAHATSKIKTFEDIYSNDTTAVAVNTAATYQQPPPLVGGSSRTQATTMGFRGEALFCLANLSSRLVVATRCADQDMAQKLEFGRNGQILNGGSGGGGNNNSATTTYTEGGGVTFDVELIPRKVGTTVAVVRFLDAVPVRRADMKRSLPKQRAKLFRWMEAYAIFSVGVRICLMDMVTTGGNGAGGGAGAGGAAGSCREQIALSTTADSKSLQETISSVLGSSFLNTLAPLQIDLTHVVRLAVGTVDGEAVGNEKDEDTDSAYSSGNKDSGMECRDEPMLSSQWNIEGWIVRAGPTSTATTTTTTGHGKMHRPVQYYSINGRPVDLPVVTKMLNELWKSFGQVSKKPSCILRLNLPASMYDINLSPDKRQVLLTHETEILHAIRQHVSQMWATQSNGRFAMNQILSQTSDANAATAAAEDNEDDAKWQDDNEEKEDEEPGLFNRRYAFSHDFSKAKLQHEYHDGRVKRSRTMTPPGTSEVAAEAESAGPHDNDNNGKDTDSANVTSSSTNESSSRKRLRVEISTEQKPNMSLVTPSPAKVDDFLPAPSESSLSSSSRTNETATALRSTENPSLAEHRQWHKVQASFQRHDEGEDDIEQEIASISQRQQTATKSAAISSDSSGQPNPCSSSTSTGNISTATGPKKYSLDQFLFRTVKPTNRNNSNSAAATAATASTKAETTTTSATPSSNARRVSDVRGDSAHSRTVETRCENTEDVAIAEQTLDHNALQETQTEETETSGESRRARTERAPEYVTWSSFHCTNKVISLSRQHRLALLERKRKYQKERTGPNHQATVNLTKADFKDNITVLGQFNMGFILAKTRDNHLWILDQHACDERYNFEKLAAETIIQEQPLIAPYPLELSPAEEICVQDNLDIFQKNGFRFAVDQTKPPRHRLSLIAVPVSGAADGKKAVQFGKDDVSALCSILGVDGSSHEVADGGTGTDGTGMYGNNAVRRYAGGSSTTGSTGDTADRILARLPKAIAMFASRACRSSVMIGKPLSESEMERIVQRLSDLENPWHCAHGRTTVNHVGDLGPLMARDEHKASAHVAGPTVTVMSQMEGPDED